MNQIPNIEETNTREGCRHCEVAAEQGVTHIHLEVDNLINDFEKQFCNTVGAPGGPTIVRWLNFGSSDQENAALTSKMVAWLRLKEQAHHQELQKARESERKYVINEVKSLMKLSKTNWEAMDNLLSELDQEVIS